MTGWSELGRVVHVEATIKTEGEATVDTMALRDVDVELTFPDVKVEPGFAIAMLAGAKPEMIGRDC
jgi:hypothetical protein